MPGFLWAEIRSLAESGREDIQEHRGSGELSFTDRHASEERSYAPVLTIYLLSPTNGPTTCSMLRSVCTLQLKLYIDLVNDQAGHVLVAIIGLPIPLHCIVYHLHDTSFSSTALYCLDVAARAIEGEETAIC